MSAEPSPHYLASRRHWLKSCSSGFGMLALSSLQHRLHATPANLSIQPKATKVILCYMSGGVSHVDSFDPKPDLKKRHGQAMPGKIEKTQFNNNGSIFGSPFAFNRYGESGLEVSDLFPEIGKCADHLAVVRSATTTVNEHSQGNYVAHTGFPFLGHPSAGAWISYGLGTANENLPSFVVLQSEGGLPPLGGSGVFSSGYLPAQHQASILQSDRQEPIPHIQPAQAADMQRRQLDFVAQIDQSFAAQSRNQQVDAAIKNYETAFRMQTSVPEVCDLSDETAATHRLYGIDDPDPMTAAYGKQALLARKLVEKGVRFVELSCLSPATVAPASSHPWDQHGNLETGHRAMAHEVDRPIAGLIQDLDARGLLDETLVVFTGEFGRTPFSQGSAGRDHNPFGFSMWLAGGGVKGGTVYGATDELGYHAVENPCTFYDLWATILHQLGIDHEQLTFRSGGRDFRLTDVHGNVLHDILA
ncbi:DUF1501 domain-containing protein [Rhodopirellula bahusiensis]|uniref:Sulfatase n=1 Tax=Rhodopirellula bahusiensis TaxID=2014065 RepID=A0A2G1W003_9BACT|nr:DUF1501 domain-containing protein [Rhodopirellula bahusiensis]PHQ32353.1 sulfatase [Rhodopirellula bahusiensis]